MNRFSSRRASCSLCRLSSRTDMTDNKRDSGDNRSPGSDDFCQNSRIFGRCCPAAVERLPGRLRWRPMKPFLKLLRKFGEIHLRNSRFSFKLNPIRFDAVHRRVFVYLALNGFEVLRKCERREQDCQNQGSTILHAWGFCRFWSPRGNGKMI
jgi:hypothetical protein